jgi:hypothetical protein
MKLGKLVLPGRWYGSRTPDGPLEDAPPGGVPDFIICRRVEDFPQGTPVGAAVQPCSRCQALIAFNAARTFPAPRICMQCARIHPLPL